MCKYLAAENEVSEAADFHYFTELLIQEDSLWLASSKNWALQEKKGRIFLKDEERSLLGHSLMSKGPRGNRRSNATETLCAT